MQESAPDDEEVGQMVPRPEGVGRRDVLYGTAAAVSLVTGTAVAQERPGAAKPQATGAPGRGGLLRPRQNGFRDVLDLSGLWRFQLDPQEEGEGSVKNLGQRACLS